MGEKTSEDMIYWPTKPGAEYYINLPLNFPLTDEEKENGVISILIRNDVGRWSIEGGGWDWSFTPGWAKSHNFNASDPDENSWPPEGEYTYAARISVPNPDGGEVLSSRIFSSGLLIFGEYATPKPTKYEQEMKYTQYGQEIFFE